MDRFENVTVTKKANIYFGGKVTSRSVMFADGTKKTLGIILRGEYEFETDDKERMEVLSGAIEALLPEADGWELFTEGQSFEVPAHSSFKMIVADIADYCCSYGD